MEGVVSRTPCSRWCTSTRTQTSTAGGHGSPSRGKPPTASTARAHRRSAFDGQVGGAHRRGCPSL